MNYLRRNQDRGHANFGWLDSKHSFSFGLYYDPAHMGISALRVINDDTVAPNMGFDTHGHQNMEIISYILEGEIAHKDSTGNDYTIPAGEVQRMSAGTGVKHSEFNASNDSALKFLQIWIQPNVQNIAPDYEQRAIEQQGQLTALVTPDREGDSLFINQNARIYRLRLEENESIELATRGENAYLHVIKGQANIRGASISEHDDLELNHGDALGGLLEGTSIIQVSTGSTPLEALWFDLP